MKKIVLLFLISFVLILTGCTTYDYHKTDSGVWVGTSTTFGRHAFAGEYDWDGTEEGKSYRVPDKYNDFVITTLGGEAGPTAPFTVNLSFAYEVESNTATDGEIPEWYVLDYEIIEIVFYVELGIYIENIKVFEHMFIKVVDEELEFVIYYVAFLFTVDEENPYIYSNNGRLYDKETDELLPMNYPMFDQ